MTIIFNGKAYHDVEEMPADVRQAYEQMLGMFADKNQNGLPDLFEAAQAGGMRQTTTSTNIIYEGELYHSLDELPPEARAKYKNAMDKLGQDHNGIPDLLEGKSGGLKTSFQTNRSTTITPSAPIAPTPSVIAPDQPNKGLLILAGAVIALLACAVIGLLGYIYLH
jgi:hypothetical protein